MTQPLTGPSSSERQIHNPMYRLDQVKDYRLVLIVGPSGSGKTSRLQAWSRQQPNVAWVSVVDADNQPKPFLLHLDRALEPFLSSGPSGYRSPAHQTLEDSLIDRINRLAESPSELILVLDGYDLIASPEIHTAVALLLDYLPPQMHLILTSRSEPPLPLPRLRVRRQLLELGAEDLQI